MSESVDPKLKKAYAAYIAGWLGKDLCEAWFPFFGDIILAIKGDKVDVATIRDKFEAKYAIRVPMEFIHKVLSIGNKEGIFSYDKQFVVIVDKVKLEKRINPEEGFDTEWGYLCADFQNYCNQQQIALPSGYGIDKIVLECIEKYDVRSIGYANGVGNYCDEAKSLSIGPNIGYNWDKYIEHIYRVNPRLFNFVSSLSYGSILKEAIFFACASKEVFAGLTVYLDAPIIFALLGVSEENRVESARNLVSNLRKAKCIILAFSHTLDEVDRILKSAKRWAMDEERYRSELASESARYFREKRLTEHEIDALIVDVKGDLKQQFGVDVKDAIYDVATDKYQIDEKQLEGIFIDRYEHAFNERPSDERIQSIRVDIRSVALIYRSRRGLQSKRIQDCKALMVTTSSTLAGVSRTFERQVSNNKVVVPTCVTANLLGTLLWLAQPKELMEHKKLELMADCVRFLRPTERMRKKFLERINADEHISRDKYYILTTSPLADQELMDSTCGNEDLITDQTPEEVYQRIVARIQASAVASYDAKIDQIEKSHAADRNLRLCRWKNFLGWAVYGLLVFLPAIALPVCVEVLVAPKKDSMLYAIIIGIAIEGIGIAEEAHIGRFKKWAFRVAETVAKKLVDFI